MSARGLVLLVLLAVGLPARAALEGPGMFQRMGAVRTPVEPTLDGRLDEAAWAQAPLFEDFVQLFPQEGAAPSERTELRVLYDERNLYIGIRCHDSQPERIVRKLGRRDSPPTSDTVEVFIDSALDHQTAYAFGVNAGGVQFDSLLLADSNSTPEWDAVWDVAVSQGPEGWSAEFSIPLQLLRLNTAGAREWGFAVQRHLARTYEDISSVFIPRNTSARVSRFGHLVGLQELQARRGLVLQPYLAPRMLLEPLATGAHGFGTPSLLLDTGLDVQASPTSGLSLNATLNPDFGQVEADQIILNLTNQEPFFPEKRPFFTQGMDLFQPVGSEGGLSPQMLFYSRRIGLTTPMLGAVKLTGSVSPTVDLGVLNALVLAPPAESQDAPGPVVRYHPSRPLHLGVGATPLSDASVPENYLVAVERTRLSETATVGAQVAAATPLTSPCTESDAALASALRPASCQALGGNAAALHASLRTADAQWQVLGQLLGSQVVGGAPSRLLPDGVLLHRGEAGYGGYLQLGKVGGEPWRFDVGYRYSSPTLELNPVGYLPSQNLQHVTASVHYVKPSGWWKLHSLELVLTGEGEWTTDGRGLERQHGANLKVIALLPGFHAVTLETGLYPAAYDVREVTGMGVPFQRPTERYVVLSGATDASKPLSLSGAAALSERLSQSTRGRPGWATELNFTLRPEDRLETRLTVAADSTMHGPRWVGAPEAGQYLFGDLHSEFLSLTLRQQVVITPRLTFQAYAQLFSGFGQYGAFYTAASEGAPIRLTDLVPTQAPEGTGFHISALNLNAVLRWEYRLGSTFFLVYTRSQQEPQLLDNAPVPSTLLPVRLFQAPSNDAVMLKWSYWLSL